MGKVKWFLVFVYLGMVNGLLIDYDLHQHQLMVPTGWQRPEMWNNPGLTTHTTMVPYEVTYMVNSLGLRGAETTLEKKPKTTRILMMGGSETFGVNVEDHDTLPARLQVILGPKYEVLNGGEVGYRVWDFEPWFILKGQFFNPDIVILTLYPGSAETAQSFDKSHDTKHRPAIEKAWRHIQNVPLVRHALIQAWQIKRFELFSKALERDEKASQDNKVQWRLAATAIAHFKYVCSQHKAKCIIQFIPLRDKVSAAYYDDLTHPNAEGYRLIATDLAKRLRS